MATSASPWSAPEVDDGCRRPVTGDSLFRGRLICRQYADGYRFSVDAVLAAHFCRPAEGATVLDLGAGCGVIGLILAHRYPRVRVTGLELQPDLVALAADNIGLNHMQDRVRIEEGDARIIGRFLAPESFDLVVCNPPYRGRGSGRASRAGEAAIARHELRATLADMVAAAAFCVRNRGAVVFVYPASRMATLLYRLQERNLAPKRLRPVYSYPEDRRGRLVLVEAVKNGGEELDLLPPLYIYERKNGPYSREMQEMYG